MKKGRSDLLKLCFTVGHDCKKHFDDGDWIEFILLAVNPEFYVFECPSCKQRACISMGIEATKTKKGTIYGKRLKRLMSS